MDNKQIVKNSCASIINQLITPKTDLYTLLILTISQTQEREKINNFAIFSNHSKKWLETPIRYFRITVNIQIKIPK